MLKRFPKIVVLAVLALVIFYAGIITANIFSHNSPIVTVRLQNASAQKIVPVHLEHEHGSLSVTNIDPGGSREVYFFVPGESSYQIQVAFADGHTITGGAGYVESGHRVTEAITDATIKSDYKLYAP